MSTGLLIRDFFKTERELRYTGQGSIAPSEIEINAYRLALTLQVTHLGSTRYGSLKTLPENTHYGYVTLFRGSTVSQLLPVKFPKFRVFDIINQGIWNYHQATEGLNLNLIGLGNQIARYANRTLEALENAPTSIWELPNYNVTDAIGNLDLIELFFDTYAGIQEAASGNAAARYRAFPVASPFPTIAKFRGDVPLSYVWRLEAWYLVNPAVYILDNPSDSGDSTDGESEYPEPIEGGPFPTPSPPGYGRDPRDYGDGATGEPEGPQLYHWVGVGNATILGPAGANIRSAVQVEFDAGVNGAPFTVSNNSVRLSTPAPGVYYAGLIVRDRFGQTVLTKYETVGFIQQSIAMTFTASLPN